MLIVWMEPVAMEREEEILSEWWVCPITHHHQHNQHRHHHHGEERRRVLNEWWFCLGLMGAHGSPTAPWRETLPPAAAATRVFNRDLGVSHTDMHSIYTQQEPVIFLLLGGTSPIFRTFSAGPVQKSTLWIFWALFFSHLSAVIFIDSRQRGNGGTQIAEEFLRDVLDSFLKAQQKQSVSLLKKKLFICPFSKYLFNTCENSHVCKCINTTLAWWSQDGRHWGYYAPVGPRHSSTREPSTLLIIMRKSKIMMVMIIFYDDEE